MVTDERLTSSSEEPGHGEHVEDVFGRPWQRDQADGLWYEVDGLGGVVTGVGRTWAELADGDGPLLPFDPDDEFFYDWLDDVFDEDDL